MNSLTIIPTYFCQYKCPFCIHREKNIDKEPHYLSDEYIKKFLEKNGDKFDRIIISGGEPLSYPKVYFDRIVNYAKNATNDVIISSFPTNIENYRDDVEYSLSYDFLSRSHAYDAWHNLLNFPKEFDLVMELTPQLYAMHPNAIFRKLTLLKNMRSVELKPVYKTQFTNWKFSQDYCDRYVKAFISSKLNLKYINVNKEKIKIINHIPSNYENKEYTNYCLLPNERLAIETYDDLSGNFLYQDIKPTDIGIIKPRYRTICNIYSEEIIKSGL